MDEAIYFIIFILVILGPLLKKIFEAAGGQGQKRPSREEVRQYLDRMRNNREHSSSLYQAPATRAGIVISPDEDDDLEIIDEGASGNRFSKFDRIGRTVANDIEKHVDEHIAAGFNEETTARQDISSKDVIGKLLAREDFSDFQKAVVLSEIFNKPRTIRKMR